MAGNVRIHAECTESRNTLNIRLNRLHLLEVKFKNVSIERFMGPQQKNSQDSRLNW